MTYCPFCGEGTDAAARQAKSARVVAPVDPVPVAKVVPASAPPVMPVPPTAPVSAVPPVVPVPPAPPSADAIPAAVDTTRARPRTPTPAKAAQGAQAAQPVVKKGGKGKWIAGGLVLLLIVLYSMRGSDKPVVVESACDAAFDQGTKAVTAGDLAAARTHALRASAECGDGDRAKATTLQKAIVAAEKTENACLRNFRNIESLLQDSRPGRARAGLNELTAACSDKPAAQDLRNRLDATQEAVQAALADVRTALDARDPAQAKAALTKLSGLNRDEPNLGQLKGEVAALDAAIAAAVQSAPPAEVFMPGPAPVQRPLARTVDPAATRAPDTGAAQRTSMASMFLRDAEQALSQRKFDTARTYVESARRVDPNNPQLDSLMQQIRERERTMLQEETTIR